MDDMVATRATLIVWLLGLSGCLLGLSQSLPRGEWFGYHSAYFNCLSFRSSCSVSPVDSRTHSIAYCS